MAESGLLYIVLGADGLGRNVLHMITTDYAQAFELAKGVNGAVGSCPLVADFRVPKLKEV